MIYLASPYTHCDPQVVEQRFQAVCKAAAELMRRGLVVFSPIAHSHPIALAGDLPTHWEYWENFDSQFIQAAQGLLVLMLAGWQESRGVRAEIAIARGLGKKVEYLNPKTLFVSGIAEGFQE